MAESNPLRKAGKISPFRACRLSANLSKNTSNERLCINGFVPKVLLSIVKRLLTISTLLSAIGFCFLVVVWPVSYHLNLSRGIGSGKPMPSDSIPITPHYRLGFEAGGMWFYTYEAPYRGSIIGVREDTNDPAPIVRAWCVGDYGFAHVIYLGRHNHLSVRSCDLPGVYFRRIWRFDDNPPYTTLRMSLWHPILLLAILPLLWAFRQCRLRFRKS